MKPISEVIRIRIDHLYDDEYLSETLLVMGDFLGIIPFAKRGINCG